MALQTNKELFVQLVITVSRALAVLLLRLHVPRVITVSTLWDSMYQTVLSARLVITALILPLMLPHLITVLLHQLSVQLVSSVLRAQALHLIALLAHTTLRLEQRALENAPCARQIISVHSWVKQHI